MLAVNIRELKPGMRLKAEVYGSNRRLLASAGTVLDEKLLRIFNIWGVTAAEVFAPGSEEPDKEALSGLDAELLAQSREWVLQAVGPLAGSSEFGAELVRLGPLWHGRTFAARSRQQADRPTAKHPAAAAPGLLQSPPPSLHALLGCGQRLAALPKVYVQVKEALEDPRCSSNRLADIVSKDVGMSARLLQLVNSPQYGQSSKVDTIMRGITVLGFKELGQLVLASSVSTMFRSLRSDVLDPHYFWKHCAACGIITRLLAAHTPGVNGDRLFVAGLLHDVGRMFMLSVMPEHLSWAMDRAAEEALLLRQAESEAFGYDHAEVGAEILQRWQLPDSLVDLVRHHHAPDRSGDALGASVLAVAEALTTLSGYGSSGNARLAASVDDAWQRLNLPLSVLDSVMMQAERQVDEIMHIFFG